MNLEIYSLRAMVNVVLHNKCVAIRSPSVTKSPSKSQSISGEISGEAVCNRDPRVKAERKNSVNRNA